MKSTHFFLVRRNRRRSASFALALARSRETPLATACFFRFPAAPRSRDTRDPVLTRNVRYPFSPPDIRPGPSRLTLPQFPPIPRSPRSPWYAITRLPVNLAASANGTVSPSDILITMSRNRSRCGEVLFHDAPSRMASSPLPIDILLPKPRLENPRVASDSEAVYRCHLPGAYNYGAGTENREVHNDLNWTRSCSPDDFYIATTALRFRRTSNPASTQRRWRFITTSTTPHTSPTLTRPWKRHEDLQKAFRLRNCSHKLIKCPRTSAPLFAITAAAT